MALIIISFILPFSFALVAWYLAGRVKRSRLLFALIGATFGVAILFPFRSFRITPLNPSLQASIKNEALVSTKQISIPGFKDAYNPSLLPLEDGYLLSFRVKYYDLNTHLKKIWNSRTSYVGLVKLNKQFELIENPYLLDLSSYADHLSSTPQDARLFRMGDKVILFFNDYGPIRHNSYHSLYATELVEKDGKWQAKHRATLLKYANMLPMEKNWTPFYANGILYLIYSTKPHLILQPDLETGICQKVCSTEVHFPWQWGEIRGGTPASPVEGGLLTFFHSSQDLPADSFFGNKLGRNYAMGAYLFEDTPPFSVKRITSDPIASLEDYQKHNRRKVIFPSGMAIDQDVIYVVWGKNDTGIYLSTFDKNKLLSSMTN